MARIEFLSAPDGKTLEVFRSELSELAEALNARRADPRHLVTVTVGEVHRDPVRKIEAIFYAFFSDHDKVARKMFKRAARTKEEKDLHTQKRIAKQRGSQLRRAKSFVSPREEDLQLCW